MASAVTEVEIPPQTLKPKVHRRRSLLVGFVIGVVALGFAPLVIEHFKNLWGHEHYKHFPIIIGAVAIMLWQRWPRRIVTTETQNDSLTNGLPDAAPWSNFVNRLWWIAVCLAIAGLCLAVLFYSPWLAMASATLMISSGVLLLAGRFGVVKERILVPNVPLRFQPDEDAKFESLPSGAIRTLLPVCLLLALTLPLPFGMDELFVQRMQRVTSDSSSRMLDVIGTKHLMAGNTLELPGKTLFVDRACSGSNSLLAMVSLALIIVVWNRSSWLIALVLPAATAIWVVAVNALRVVIIAEALVRWDKDLSTGTVHDALAISLLPITLLLMFGTLAWLRWFTDPITVPHVLPASLFNFFFHGRWTKPYDPQPKRRKKKEVVIDGAAAVQPESPPPAPLAAESPVANDVGVQGAMLTVSLCRKWLVCVLLLALLPVAAQGALALRPHAKVIIDVAGIEKLGEESLPADLNGWRRSGFGTEERERSDERGSFSRSWRFRTNGSVRWPAIISIDYPFLGWHELTHCYVGTGWKQLERQIISLKDGNPKGLRIKLQKPTGEFAYVWFTLVDSAGNRTPPYDLSRPIHDRIQESMVRYGLVATTYQIQVFIQSELELSPDELRDGEAQLDAATKILLGTDS